MQFAVRNAHAAGAAVKLNSRFALAGTRLTQACRLDPARVQYRRFSIGPRALLEEAVTDRDNRITIDDASVTANVMGETPGEADRRRFRLHWSVNLWRDFNPRSWLDSIDNEDAPVSERLQAFVAQLQSGVTATGVLGSTQAARYWAYHITRSGFFAAQAIIGLAAIRASAGRESPPEGTLTRFEQAVRSGWQGPLSEAMLSYYQDYEGIRAGQFSMPWDATTLSHRQFNPLYILNKGARFISEAAETIKRREKGVAEDVWMKSAFLPAYAQATFHYQSDGWQGSDSAKVYETSTETLFLGRQDAMQRTTLVPIAEYMQGRALAGAGVKALEVACGTGRFATFVKDNYPQLDLTLTDLSPFYLQEARSNIKYWKGQRAPEVVLPGVDGNGTSFVQAAAENMPFEDASFDIVYCVYLFHELPEDVRRQAVAEMARVVRPGGLVVLTDSVQTGDRPIFDTTIGNFGDFNEPYYRNYLSTDLGAIFEQAGLVCDLKLVSSTTKSLSFRKPLETPDVKEDLEAVDETTIPEAVYATYKDPTVN